MKSSIINTFALAGALLAAGQAFAAPAFTFDPTGSGSTTVPAPSSATFSTFTATSLTGTSKELIDFSNFGQNATATGVVIFDSAYLGSNKVETFGSLSHAGYGLYLTFTLNDVLSGSAGGVNTYALQSLTYNFYIDTGNDTTISDPTLTGNAPVVTAGTPDVLLATGSLVFGTATIVPNTAGATLVSTQSVIDPNNQYFTAPSPFYALVLDSLASNNGAFTSAQDAFGNGYATIIGAGGTVTFSNVPEPSTLALCGIAALGLGLSARRRKA